MTLDPFHNNQSRQAPAAWARASEHKFQSKSAMRNAAAELQFARAKINWSAGRRRISEIRHREELRFFQARLPVRQREQKSSFYWWKKSLRAPLSLCFTASGGVKWLNTGRPARTLRINALRGKIERKKKIRATVCALLYTYARVPLIHTHRCASALSIVKYVPAIAGFSTAGSEKSPVKQLIPQNL